MRRAIRSLATYSLILSKQKDKHPEEKIIFGVFYSDFILIPVKKPNLFITE